MYKLILSAVFLVTTAGCASTPPQSSSPVGSVLVTTSGNYEIQEGPGAEVCSALDQIHESISGRELAVADADLRFLISQFDPYHVEGKRTLSFGNEEDYRLYLETGVDPAAINPVDWCYRELFQLRAFIRASEEQYEDALSLLDQSIAVGPTAAGPLVERGYILNRQNRFQEARDSYQSAIRLVNQYPVSRPQMPLALRGLGFALIELGDLEGAEKAFNDSLQVDPDNELAVSELKYIRSLKKRAR